MLTTNFCDFIQLSLPLRSLSSRNLYNPSITVCVGAPLAGIVVTVVNPDVRSLAGKPASINHFIGNT